MTSRNILVSVGIVTLSLCLIYVFARIMALQQRLVQLESLSTDTVAAGGITTREINQLIRHQLEEAISVALKQESQTVNTGSPPATTQPQPQRSRPQPTIYIATATAVPSTTPSPSPRTRPAARIEELPDIPEADVTTQTPKNHQPVEAHISNSDHKGKDDDGFCPPPADIEVTDTKNPNTQTNTQ